MQEVGGAQASIDLQKLVGRLQYIAKCVTPARRFMARIHTALRNTPFKGKHPVPDNLRADIRWFLEFAERSNGLVLLNSEPRLP